MIQFFCLSLKIDFVLSLKQKICNLGIPVGGKKQVAL